MGKSESFGKQEAARMETRGCRAETRGKGGNERLWAKARVLGNERQQGWKLEVAGRKREVRVETRDYGQMREFWETRG